MATFKICVFEHQQREDGRFPVSIRLTNNRRSVYLKTGMYANRSQVSKDFSTIKDRALARAIDRKIQEYEEQITQKLGVNVEKYSARELSDFLTKQASNDTSIDFIEFSREHIASIRQNGGSEAYAQKLEAPINLLIDYFDREQIYIREITARSLQNFSDYLRSDKKMIRQSKSGDRIELRHKGVSERTVADYMTCIRTLFNAAIERYNDEDMGISVITHYPFRKLKIKSRFQSKNRNLSISDIQRIKDSTDAELATKRAILARDVFMLSFYLVGTNLIDLYYLTDYKNGRISYNRRKTSGRREDGAFISIKVEPEAESLMEKYIDTTGERALCFHKLYGNHTDFVKNVNIGLKQLAETIGLEAPITSYWARHSWATIARNDCGVSKDDINLALNHVDKDMAVTDIYIAKDWSIIDRANRKVIDLFSSI